MALNTYPGIVDAIRRWSKRGTNVSDDEIADFIAMTEDKIYANEFGPLRIREMDTRATAQLSTTSYYLALPDDFLEQRKFSVNINFDTDSGISSLTDPQFRDIRYMVPEQIDQRTFRSYPGFFSVTSQLEFDTIPAEPYTITMQYFKRLTPISTTTTNAILQNYPNIYLHGGLWALWQYFKEEELSEYYYKKFTDSINAVNKSALKARYGVAPVIKSERYKP